MMKNIWSFLCFLVLVFILLLDISTHTLHARSADTLKVVNANEINLIDKSGRKCASLFVNSLGEASLQLGPAKAPEFVATIVSPEGIGMWKGGKGKPITLTNLGADMATVTPGKGKLIVIWDTSRKE